MTTKLISAFWLILGFTIIFVKPDSVTETCAAFIIANIYIAKQFDKGGVNDE